MRNDANEQDPLQDPFLDTIGRRPHAEANVRAESADDLPAELLPTHEALMRLADTWSGAVPPAERLSAFTRDLPTRQASVTEMSKPSPLSERPHTEARAASDGCPPQGRGRLLAGLVAAVVVVALLAATLLKLAPGRAGHGVDTAPTVTAVATATALTARATEEPSQEPPAGAWATVAHAQLIPAPSDGRVVYKVDGAAASVSQDGGATWQALKLPTFSSPHVISETLNLAVSDADSQLVALGVGLSIDSANPADCPTGSSGAQPTAMHGGIMASGYIICDADFISYDGGVTWTPSHGVYNGNDQSTLWQIGDSLYGLSGDVNRTVAPAFPLVGLRLMASRDRGATWNYADTTLRQPSRFVCNYLPSHANGALYAITAASPCYSGAAGAHTVWRSMDGGATWSPLSTISALSLWLVSSSPSADGHGLWLYALKGDSETSAPATLLASQDGGASWSQTLPAPGASGVTTVRPVNGALADGSLVVAVIAQSANTLGRTPGKATFYAWRPGDSAWRPLTPSLTAYYSSYFVSNGTAITIARGGQGAVDTLWVVEALSPYSQNVTAHTYLIR